MQKKHWVLRSAEEPTQRHARLTSGTLPVRTIKRAQMLLNADESTAGLGWNDATISHAFEVHGITVGGVRKRYVDHGVDVVLPGRATGLPPPS